MCRGVCDGVCLRGVLCVCCVSRWPAPGCGVCLLFCAVAVFVQRASGCVLRLSGRGKLWGVCAGLCAPGRVRGRSAVPGMRSAPEGGVCLSRGRRVCWVPGEGPQGGRRLLARRGARNPSPFPHEILIEPRASRRPWRNPGQATGSQLGRSLSMVLRGGGEARSPHPTSSAGAPAREYELACSYRL